VNRRQFLGTLSGVYGLGFGAVGTVAVSGFRVDGLELETMYDRPNYAWGIGTTGSVDPDQLGDPKGRTELSTLNATALSSLEPSLATALRTVVSADRRHDGGGLHPEATFDTEPTQLRERLATVGWVDGFDDGVIRAFAPVATGANGPPPIAVEASLSSPITTVAKPVTLALTARNRSDRAAVVFGGPRPPFDSVSLEPVKRTEPGIPLFAPDDPLGHVPPFRSLATTTPGTRNRYDPGASTTLRYQLRAGEKTVQPGRYKATGSFEFGTLVPWEPRSDGVRLLGTLPGGWWAVSWGVTLEITKL
jgi:hypothetical protein